MKKVTGVLCTTMSCCVYTPFKYSYNDKAVWQLCCDMNLFGLKSLDNVTINYPDVECETISKAKQHKQFMEQDRERLNILLLG